MPIDDTIYLFIYLFMFYIYILLKSIVIISLLTK